MININKTPVRTSENYGVNDYKIDENLINRNIKEFNNFHANAKLNDIAEKVNLTYGLGRETLNQINEESNFKKEIILENDNFITFTFDENNKALVECLKITVKKAANGKLIIKYKSDLANEYYHNGLIKIVMEESASAKIVLVNEINNSSINLLSIDSELDKNSKLDFAVIDLGGRLSVSNYYSKLEESSENNLNAIFLGTDKSELDINYIMEIFGKRANANINVEGALTGNAKKNFKGTIDFKKGCTSSIGKESENTLLLSDNARSKSLPMLLCTEENVEGSHSSSTGRIGKKELFYLTSRGISENDAKKLLVRARFDKVLNMIEEDETLNEIIDIMNERIN